MSRLDVWDDVLFLSSPDNFATFFVPNNNAMEKIPAGELRKLEVDPVRLYQVRSIENLIYYSIMIVFKP